MTEKSNIDVIKYALAGFFLLLGIAANYYYHDVIWSVRVLAGLLVMLAALALVAPTSKGKQLWQYIKDAQSELQRVVWPGRDEVIQVAFFVIAMVMVMVVILWGVDSVLMKAISWLTGQRG